MRELLGESELAPSPGVIHACSGLVAIVALTLALLRAIPLGAQGPLERTVLMERAGVGLPWLLEANTELRTARERPAPGLVVAPTFELGLGMPRRSFVAARFSPQSPVVLGEPDEWEVRGRLSAVAEERGNPIDLVAQAGFNGAAGSLDVEITASRRLGPFRLLGTVRAFSDAWGTGSGKGAIGAGVVLFPRPHGLPVALTADVVTLPGAAEEERTAWSTGATLGLPYSNHSLSVFVTNTGSGTLQGTSVGARRVRAGIGFTVPLPVGRTLGQTVPRATAGDAVTEVTGDPAPDVRATIARHAYSEGRIEIDVGASVEWTNEDEVVHTVTADDGAWDSGAIEPGASWQARFDEAGIYPFHCGPHPYMRGVVIVR